MRKRIVIAAVGCVAAGSMLLSACASPAGATVSVPSVVEVKNLDEEENRITVSSAETVQVVPDMAEISFSVVTEQENAEACQQENTENLNRLLEYLKGLGFEDKSIATSGFSLYPRYDWSTNRQVLVGYEMSTDVTVSDVPMEQAGGILTDAVTNGANRINSVSYYSSGYDEAYNEALAKAVELARSKGEALAKASGKKLGEVRSIQEFSDSQYGRYVDSDMRMSSKNMAMEGAGAAADMGVMPGEMQITAEISVEFALIPEENEN